ncbi:hypothetical protein MHK_001123 [Candidatus Magnetomorum sp. HK-1]|nr:hypothetical protein MHK_001123 [Candidatus Magnetomorum sp. HK-1]
MSSVFLSYSRKDILCWREVGRVVLVVLLVGSDQVHYLKIKNSINLLKKWVFIPPITLFLWVKKPYRFLVSKPTLINFL